MSNIPEFNRDLSQTTNTYNRGKDTQQFTDIVEPVKIGLMTIDNAILKFIQDKINRTISQNGKAIKVPVVYGNPERWKAIQKDGYFRDQNGKIQLPIIMVRRTGMRKNTINSPVNKHQNYLFKTGWNARNVYDKFAVLNKMIPSEAYHTVVVPDFYDVSYEVVVWTEYIQQMNSIIENISFEEGEYWGEDNNYKFISKISQYEQQAELPNSDDRIIRSRFNIDVKAYILPESSLSREGARQNTTRMVYGPKRVVFNTEIVNNLEK